MSNALLSSKVVVTEAQSTIISVPALPTAVAAMVGITERGPLTRQFFTSFSAWRRVYGGATPESAITFATVQGFYEEGGQFLWFTRTLHYTDVGDRGTATGVAATVTANTATSSATSGSVLGSLSEPYPLTPGDTVIVQVDGGGDQTATVDATAASITAGTSPTYDFSSSADLTVTIDGGSPQTISFAPVNFATPAAATGAEVAAVINGQITGAGVDLDGGDPRITSDTLGTDSGVQITAGGANTQLGFSTTLQSGTGDVANIDTVTAAEIAAVVTADVTGATATVEGGAVRVTSDTTGASSSVLVNVSSTADDELGLDNALHVGVSGVATATLVVNGKTVGAYGNALSVVIRAATNGEAARFNLDVRVSGAVEEPYQNLTMDPDDPNYVETIINDVGIGSRLITVVDQDLSTGAANARPANATLTLAGGSNGLSGLADSDFIGSEAASPGTGFRSFDDIAANQSRPTLLAAPARVTAAVANALLTYGEITMGGAALAIIDSPEGMSATQIVDYINNTAAIGGLSEYAAAYWKRVKVINPNRTTLGNTETITIPSSGHVMGMMARNDASKPGGIYIQPAGPEFGTLRTIVGFEDDEVHDVRRRDLVFPNRINIIDQEGGVRNVDGARTLRGTGNFPSVGERRAVIFIETTIRAINEIARHQNNTPQLRARLDRSVNQFLINQMNLGAFRSNDPETAFFVDYDIPGTGLNVPSEVFAGRLNARIGLATNKPAEFIILEFSQDTRALEQQLNS